MNRGPGEILRPWSTFARKDTRLYQEVQSGPKQLKWIETAVAGLGGVHIPFDRVSSREGRPEETRFCQSKLQIARSNRAKIRSRHFRRTFAAPDTCNFGFNGTGERGKSRRSDGL